MKCILIDKHGEDIDKLLTIAEDHPKPIRKKGEVLIQVQACALAPGDIRVMKGHCDYFQAPRSFPYIPGGDISGTVQEADEDSRFHKEGDAVLAMFEIPRPLDGLAEYACAKESLVELVSKESIISPAEAACLTSSALFAFHAVEHVKTGSRVLILGGSGGVGTFLIQLARNAGASYIATTSTDEQLCHSLGADYVIN
jgi:NADPH:quinone reductase-like Zn-dependent oxidoreductase